VHLGGHWISLFPQPVYWLLRPKPGTPFEQKIDGLGNRLRRTRREGRAPPDGEREGLMWTAHPRIKSSYGFPDRYREKDFYLSDRFLGAAWKAMPADLSHPRLGVRSLRCAERHGELGQRTPRRGCDRSAGNRFPRSAKKAIGQVESFSR